MLLFLAALWLAVLLDFLAGDPRQLPHPVRLIGWLCQKLERWCRMVFVQPKFAGLCVTVLVLLATGLGTASFLLAARLGGQAVFFIATVVLLYYAVALRDLLQHSQAVYDALAVGDMVMARQKVGMIVGRDTNDLDTPGVIRACVESVAENMGDGVFGPVFWAVAGALLGDFTGLDDPLGASACGSLAAILYKAVSTMDSMFGYKNSAYLDFGRWAATLDDLANFLPARLAALAIVAAAFMSGQGGKTAWLIYQRDRYKHASPNAGCPEAAMAGALGIRLGGVGRYNGIMVEKPYLGDKHHPLRGEHIVLANRLVQSGSLMAILFFTFSYVMIRLLFINS